MSHLSAAQNNRLPGNEEPEERKLEGSRSRILDPSWPYIPSHATDLRATFKRIRREQLDALKAPAPLRIIEKGKA